MSEFHAEAPQATASEGLAQGPYVAARARVEPMTLWVKGVDSTNAPPMSHWHIHVSHVKLCRVVFQDGSFLVRKSQRGGESNPYTLTLLYKGFIYNLHIRRRSDQKYALGSEKPDEHVRIFFLQFLFEADRSANLFHAL